MKEKLMELEMLMRSVRAKMEELRDIGVTILSVMVTDNDDQYNIQFSNAIQDAAEEFGIDTELVNYDKDPGWSYLRANHEGVSMQQWQYKADRFGFARRDE